MTATPSSPPVIVLVEDERLLRMASSDLLDERGYQVIEAEDADAALAIMEARPDVRLLFTDIQMPGSMDGMELARMVHENWPKVKLLLTSGNLRPSTAEIPDHGHFLSKPYRGREVIEEVDTLLGNEQGSSAPKRS
jgi:two-component system, response regulator PdtaR